MSHSKKHIFKKESNELENLNYTIYICSMIAKHFHLDFPLVYLVIMNDDFIK